MVLAYSLDGDDHQRVAAIGDSLIADPDDLVAICEEHLAYAGKNYLPFSRKQIAWLNIKHITEDVLEQAIVKVINAYNKFELPG